MVANDIPKLILDPENESDMLQQLYQRVIAASNGKLTDFSPGSVLAALAEGQVFAIAELLYFLNMLPEASALEVFRLSGSTRSLGTKARGTLVFLLNSPLSDDFVVPEGYIVPYSPVGSPVGNAGYQLLETLVIPKGAIDGSVDVEATIEGSFMNLEPFSIRLTSTGFAYVESIYNPERIGGGSDLEDLESFVRRAQVKLRDRDVLVSVTDYEAKAVELYGAGYAKAIPLLGADKESEKIGHLHVFVSTDDLKPPTSDNLSFLQSEMQKLSFAGSRVWVSACDFQKIQLEVLVEVETIDPATGQAILDTLTEYLLPSDLGIGNTVRVKRLEYLVQTVPGVVNMVSVLIDGLAVDKPMPTPYTVPFIDLIALTQIDSTGLTSTQYLGKGQGDVVGLTT